MDDLELTPPVFAILSSLIEERIGLTYTAGDRDLLASKVSVRAAELGFGSLLDYYYFLRYDASSDAEFTALVNALVVNETFFFREFTPLSVMVAEVVVPRAAAGQRPRIWCAACSTGEEPITLAMLLEQHGLLDRVEIVASDISSSALARAQSGQYSRRSLRQVPDPSLAAKWLEMRDQVITVPAALRESIQWKQLNLMDDAAVAKLGSFDLILCRNVLIYFSDATVSRVVSRIGARLRVDGALLVGVSESLLRFGSSLRCEESSGIFYYRKAAI